MKQKYFFIFAAVVLVMLAVGIWLDREDLKAQDKVKAQATKSLHSIDPKANLNPPLFKCGEIMENVGMEDVMAKVCIDANTGVRYLYGRGGSGNGGPFMVRLWDK